MNYQDFNLMIEELDREYGLVDLDESILSQRSIEAVSKFINEIFFNMIWTDVQKGTEVLNLKKYKINTNKTNKLTAWIKKSTKLEPTLKAMLLDGLLIMFEKQEGNIEGSFWQNNNPKAFGNVPSEISIGVPHQFRYVVREAADMLKHNETISKSKMREYYDLYVTQTTIEHEMQHAFDAYRSGDAEDYYIIKPDNPKGRKAYKSKGVGKAWTDKNSRVDSETKDKQSYEDYLNYTHEINARYTQTMIDLRRTMGEDPDLWGNPKRYGHSYLNKAFIELFKNKFDGKWERLHDETIKKKLIKRAAAELAAWQKSPTSNTKQDMVNKLGVKTKLYKLMKSGKMAGIYKVNFDKVKITEKRGILTVDFRKAGKPVKRPTVDITMMTAFKDFADENNVVIYITLESLMMSLAYENYHAFITNTHKNSIGKWEIMHGSETLSYTPDPNNITIPS